MTDIAVNAAGGAQLTSWANEPTLLILKQDLENAKQTHSAQITKIDNWNDLLQVTGLAAPKKVKGRSSVQPKLIRRQAEWRYSALTEPFLGSNKLFKVSPVTFEDADAAKQNELLLNWQFRTKFNRIKFIDEYVRSTVDEGTCIVRTGWTRYTTQVQQEVPVWGYYQLATAEEADAFKQALSAKQDDPRDFDASADPAIKAAVEYYEEKNVAVTAKQNGTQKVTVEKVIQNQPTAEILNPKNVIIDPTCGGDIEKAMFIVVSFETTQAELTKEGKKYKNLDKVDWASSSPLSEPDHATNSPQEAVLKGNRKRVVAYEYWGFYDIHGDGKLFPFVATWIGNTLIRMELNPFPDQKLPFVLVPYMPVKRNIYGEPDAELLSDNQAILGAVARGMIDLMAKSANAQHGFAKGMLDPLNRRRYEQGQDYEFNPNTSPQQGLIEHKYPELPQSALAMVTMQNQEAEALTGVKSFSGGISGEAYGDVAAGIRGVLDAASKREMAILRRLAKGITDIGNKFIAMNAVFLSEQEVVRVTNSKYVTINREDLAGNFDLETDIATAEVDDAKSKDLAFMLQTMGPAEDPEMRRMILAEIADLKRMPEFAHRIRTFQPQPDPMQVQMQQLQLKELEAKIEMLQSTVDLNKAKAKQASSAADKADLDFVEQETGTTHEREKERIKAQAEGNQNLEVTKALLKTKKPDESHPDIEAAVGFNNLTNQQDRASPDQQNPADTTVQRDALAEQDPRYSLGSRFFDPSLDPSTNPNVNMQ